MRMHGRELGAVSVERKTLPRMTIVATLSSVVLDILPNAFSHGLAQERGLSDRRLRGLVADGALERLGHGLYRKADAPPADLDRIEIALRASDATLCLTTALSHHDLTDVIPAEIDVALPRSRRSPKVSAPVRWHRFHEDTFLIGRETIEVDEGLSLGVYDAERSVIDAFRLRHQEGEELAVEALRRWLERRGAAPADLLAMARRFPKVEASLLQVLRILS
jgi:predicted transcriptional regulator of viral defense system